MCPDTNLGGKNDNGLNQMNNPIVVDICCNDLKFILWFIDLAKTAPAVSNANNFELGIHPSKGDLDFLNNSWSAPKINCK